MRDLRIYRDNEEVARIFLTPVRSRGETLIEWLVVLLPSGEIRQGWEMTKKAALRAAFGALERALEKEVVGSVT